MRPTAGRGGWARSALLGLAVGGLVVSGSWGDWVGVTWWLVNAVHVVVSVTLVVGGYRLAARPGQRTNGRILMTAGAFVVLGWVSWQYGPVPVLVWVVPSITSVLLAWLLLRYPNDHLTDRFDRLFVAVAFPLVLGLRIIETVMWDPAWRGYTGPASWPTLLHSEHLHTITFCLVWVTAIALGLVFIVVVVRKHRRSSSLTQRQAMPLLVAGVVGALVFGVLDAVIQLVALAAPALDNAQALTTSIAESVALLVMMGAFVVAALLQALQRARVTQLLVDKEAAHDPEALQRALRGVLADPGLRLLFRESAEADWVDVGGEAVTLPDGTRVLVPVDARAGAPLAVLLADPRVSEQEDLLEAAVAASRMALDNARLQALAQARLEEVARSRQRLAQVGTDERRRLERDLHDGAQQRLLSVAAALASARASTEDPAMHRRLDDVRDGLRSALKELRDLANGIHPAVLTQAGLGAAIESAAERLALSARIEVEAGRWPPEVESAAYFVTSEALANAVKHADAGHVTISAIRVGSALCLTIVDDGSGGASTTIGRGGLTGMSDRVAALGGTLTLTSPAGAGTTIVARFPCD